VKIAPEIVAEFCRKYADAVLTPTMWQGTRLDKVRLLWGIAGVESSFGERSNPHHDASYCVGGRWFDREKTLAWGCLAHCSFGPWQVEFPNFPIGVSPLSLMWSMDGRIASELCLAAAVRVLNRAIAAGSRNLGDIVYHYNGPGNVDAYSARLSECFDHPMPEVSAPVTA
jgi:hypothetical protein